MTLDELLDLTGLSPDKVEKLSDKEIGDIVRPHLPVTQPAGAPPAAGAGGTISTAAFLATSKKKKVVTTSNAQDMLRQLAEMKEKLKREGEQPT